MGSPSSSTSPTARLPTPFSRTYRRSTTSAVRASPAGWPGTPTTAPSPACRGAGVLRAIQVSERYGRTGFLDKIRLYDTLRSQINDLRVVYRFEPRMGRNPYGIPSNVKLHHSSAGMDSIVGRLGRDFPPVSHPLVLTQAETGRQILNFSPTYAIGIEGMPDDDANELLTALAEHCTSAEHAYVHDWQVHDLVAWDDWRMLH
jgi:taurine dioxygenase